MLLSYDASLELLLPSSYGALVLPRLSCVYVLPHFLLANRLPYCVIGSEQVNRVTKKHIICEIGTFFLTVS
jgi:hypothetical protein